MHLEIHLPLLLDLFLKSTVLLALAALLTVAFHRASAANRHAIAVAALVTLLVLPFTKLVRPRWSYALNHDAPAAPLIIKLPPITTAASSETGSGGALAAPVNVPAKAAGIRVNGSAVGVGVWLAGFALALICRAGVGLQLRRLAGESRAMKEGRVLAMARELAAVCGVCAEIRESDTCRVPLAFGVWRPTVLLPGEAMGWSDARLSAALQHEFGHIRRRDCLTRWFADLVCAFYWMNPLVWVGARSLRLAQEQACDDLVLNAGTRPDDYATQLVEVVRGLQGDRFTARHALAMAQPSTLETRVRAIVDETRDRSARSARGAFAGFAFATAALALCTAAQLRGADEKKSQPSEKESREAREVGPNAGAPQVQIVSKFIEITADAASDPAMSWLPASPKPGAAIGGGTILLTEEQARDAIAMAGRKKGVDLLSAPSVVTRSKQRAIVEVIREFRYPNEWEKDGKPGAWKPSGYETKNVGVTIEVEPTAQADGSIKLHVAPQVVEFLGFIDLDAKRKAAPLAEDLSKPLNDRLWSPRIGVVHDGHRAQPVFSTRQVKTDIVVQPGETLLLECGAADVEKAAVGRKDKAKAKADAEAQPRRLVILVTARVVKPDAIPAAEPKADSAGKTEVHSDSVTADRDTGKVRASGNVKIETAQAVIAGKEIEIAPKKAGTAKEATMIGAEKSAAKIIFPKIDFRDATLGEVVDFLVAKSKSLDPEKKGINVVLKDGEKFRDVRITLTLADIPLSEVLRYVASLAGAELRSEAFAYTIEPAGAAVPKAVEKPAPAEAKPTGAAMKKAAAIIFPKIDLNDATLSETVDFLRAKAKDLDPDKQGVNLILKRAAAGEEPKITLSLANIPLSEVLRYVAALANFEIVAEDQALIVQESAPPFGIPVEGKPGFVTSPFSPTQGYIDVRGFPPNTKVKDPYSGRFFLTP